MFKQKVQEHKLFELNLLQFSLVHQLFKEGKGCKDQPQNLYTQNYKEGIWLDRIDDVNINLLNNKHNSQSIFQVFVELWPPTVLKKTPKLIGEW